MTDGNPDRDVNQPRIVEQRIDLAPTLGPVSVTYHCGICRTATPGGVENHTCTPPPASTLLFTKHDAGKNLLGCLPPRALLAIGRVLTFGAGRYGRSNWHRNRSLARYYDALLRHLFAWWSGEDKDPETGESHLAHAGCCLMFLLELIEVGAASETQAHEDDRPTLGRVEKS